MTAPVAAPAAPPTPPPKPAPEPPQATSRETQEPPDERAPWTEWASWEVTLTVLGVLMAVGVSTLGLISSYQALYDQAARPVSQGGWGWSWPWLLPVGVDLSILAFGLVNLLLVRVGRPLWWVRWVPRAGTAVTIYLNWHAASALPSQLGHAALASLWVVFSEVAAHLYAAHIDPEATRQDRRQRIPTSRWVLSPLTTARLSRLMTLWDITYTEALERDREYRVYRQRMRQRHGRRWRITAPPEELLPVRLAPYGLTVEEALAVPAAEEAAALRRAAAAEAERAEADSQRESAALQREAQRLQRQREVQQLRDAIEADRMRVEAERQAEAQRREMEAQRLQIEAEARAAEARAEAERRREELRLQAENAQLRRQMEREQERRQAEARRREEEARAAEAEARRQEAERCAAEERQRAAEAERLAAEAERRAAEERQRAAEAEARAAEAAAMARLSPAEWQARRVAAMIQARGQDVVTLDVIREELGVSEGTASNRRRRALELLASSEPLALGGAA